MWIRALEVAGDNGRAAQLVGATLALADECVQDARSDLGIGAVHLPEPSILGIDAGMDPQQVLTERCRAAVGGRFPEIGDAGRHTVLSRLDDELRVIADLGYPTYFLTVAEVTDLIKARGVRVAARGSGAGSLVNYLLGISGVDPIRHDLLMERFCSPLRAELPDIDVDVESARRTEIYQAILDRFGGDRVTCVSMMDTYKVRHAIRDVGAALGMPPVEIDEIAKAFPHIRARDARSAIADLPELRSRGLDAPRLDTFFELVERLDGLPRHIALHPCGVVLSNAGLLDRTPGRGELAGLPDEPVRQGRRRDPRAAQARRPRHPHAVGDGPRRRRGPPGRRRRGRPRRRGAGAARRRGDVPAHPHDAHPRLLPDREPGAARAHRQVRARALRRPHHRHLALPPRAGEVRHDHAVPREPARLVQAPAAAPDARAGPGRDRGRRRLPRAGAADRRRDDRGDARPGRRGAPHDGHAPGAGSTSRRGGVRRPGRAATPRTTSTASGRCSSRSRRSASARRTPRPSPCRPTTRRGSRPTTRRRSSPGCSPTTRGCIPSGSSSTTPARSASPSSALDVNASGDTYRIERLDGRAAVASPTFTPDAPRPARRERLRHPPLAHRRQGHQRRRGREHRCGTAVLEPR